MKLKSLFYNVKFGLESLKISNIASFKCFGSEHHISKSHDHHDKHKIVNKENSSHENHNCHNHDNHDNHDSHDHHESHSHGHDSHRINPLELYFSKPFHSNHYKFNHLDHHNSHGHGHGHDVGYKSKFDHVKYTRTLNQSQRIDENQKVDFVDNDLNPQTSAFSKGQFKATPGIMDKMSEVMIPFESVSEVVEQGMDITEIKARIYNLLRQFDFLEIEKFDFSKDYNELGLDSLDWTALLTSIEYEFHTVFNDTFYEHWNCLDDVVQHLKNDEHIF